MTAVAERDLVYTDAYFGASLPREQLKSARLISAILCSALASWFFLMTAAEFGVWKRRLLTSDVELLPLPDPGQAVTSDAGRKIVALEAAFRANGPNEIRPSGARRSGVRPLRHRRGQPDCCARRPAAGRLAMV